MRIGVPTEIKSNEFRVGLTPSSVRELTSRGHEVLVQSGAGEGIFAADADYVRAGARIVAAAGDVFAQADMIVKVKEPQAPNIGASSHTRSCSPICTSRPILNRLRACWRLARRPLPMRP